MNLLDLQWDTLHSLGGASPDLPCLFLFFSSMESSPASLEPLGTCNLDDGGNNISELLPHDQTSFPIHLDKGDAQGLHILPSGMVPVLNPSIGTVLPAPNHRDKTEQQRQRVLHHANYYVLPSRLGQSHQSLQ
jgi:hypothetical protein